MFEGLHHTPFSEAAVSTLTRWVLAHRRIVVAFWVVMTVTGIAAAGPASRALKQEFSVPGKEGWKTNVAIAERYGDTGGQTPPLVPVVTLPAGKTVDLPRGRGQLTPIDARGARAPPPRGFASYAATRGPAVVSPHRRT